MAIFDRIKRFVRNETLSCEDVNRFLVDYLDGSMEDPTRMRFEAHLRNCPNCERFMDQYRETVTIVKSETVVDVPDEVVRRTIDFLKNHYDEDA